MLYRRNPHSPDSGLVFFFVCLSHQVLAGLSLLSNILIKGGAQVSWKTGAAVLLYANVLYRRMLEIPELKVRNSESLTVEKVAVERTKSKKTEPDIGAGEVEEEEEAA